MKHTEIKTDKAPQAVGPYSQGIIAGEYVYVSGQIALVPSAEAMIEGGVKEQAEQVLRNIEAVLDAAGCTLADVVFSTIYLTSMDDFAVVNEVYASRFVSKPQPARATIAVATLPKGALVEVVCTAYNTKK